MADGLSEPLLPEAEGEQPSDEGAPEDLRIDMGSAKEAGHGEDSKEQLKYADGDGKGRTATAGHYGQRRRTLSGSAPLRRRHTATLAPPREMSGTTDVDDVSSPTNPSSASPGTTTTGSPEVPRSLAPGAAWKRAAGATKTLAAVDTRSMEQRLSVAQWCYNALEGGYSPIPLAWWCPSTTSVFTRPDALIALYIFAVILPMTALLLYGFAETSKVACGANACPAITIQNGSLTVTGGCTVSPPGYFGATAVCSYVGPPTTFNITTLQYPLCPEFSRASHQPVVWSSNQTISIGGHPDFSNDKVLPAIACGYLCTEALCPGMYTVPNRGAAATWMALTALSALVIVVKVLTLQSSLQPYPVQQLIRKLTAGLPMGTFMVSYSWGSREGEECSSTVVAELAELLPSCWWDKEQLLPGASVTEMCTMAASGCRFAFVFISFAYLRSPICKTEFAVLRETRGKILAAIHSDVARSAEGIALMAELEAEGHRIWIVRVAEARDVGVIAASFNLCYNGMLRPMLRVCGRGANGGSKAESFVFHIGGRWVGTIEFLWLVLCAGDVLLDVFKIRSPPMNAAGWKITAAVLRGSHSYRRRVYFAVMSLGWPVISIYFAIIWEKEGDHIYAHYYVIMAAMFWAWVMLVLGSRMIRADRITAHRSHDALAEDGLPVEVAAKSIPRKSPAESTMPSVGGLLTILHRAGIIGSCQREPFGVSHPAWPLPRGLLPAAIHVDIGDGVPARRLFPLVAAEVIRIVPRGTNTAELRLIKLEPGVPIVGSADSPDCIELFWSECGFVDLHPDTQDIMSNRIVMVGTPGGPCIETLIIQILLWMFKSDSSKVFSGSGKTQWRSKSLRAAFSRR